MKKEKGPLLLLNLDKAGKPRPEQEQPAAPPDSPRSTSQDSTPPLENAAGSKLPPEMPEFPTIEKRPWLLGDLFRAFLVILSLVVAAGLVLILLPQPSIDKMTSDLQARHAKKQPELIALLYLGDQTKDSEFHVRGVVRNITAAPIEQLDAAVRFYGHDGSVLETTVVRMNKDSIAPDEIAQFELVYPNYKMEFAKYSVEFKLRDGGMVSYKDMRATQ